MQILGIWDGHDAGACIVEDGKVKVAINEERLAKKKLYIGFPYMSVKACLNQLNLKPEDISVIAASGNQFSRILARTIPSLDENYYKTRRRLIEKPGFEKTARLLKYRIAELSSNSIFENITKYQIKRKLDNMGFKNYKLHIVDHHMAHAAGAIFTSGFNKNLCITLDGVGDGLSGTVNVYDNGEIERLSAMSGQDSLGMMYEQVTTLIGMRELEDEGKTMCLADYSYPVPEDKNKLINFFEIKGLHVKSKYTTLKRYVTLERIMWNTEREKFAHMTQRALEKHMTQLFDNAISETGMKNVCWSGGVAANIKANRIIRLNSGLKKWFVFPHMGDGGLAVGAALYVSHIEAGTKPYKMPNAYLGLEFTNEQIEAELEEYKRFLKWEENKDVAGFAGDLLSKGQYLFWFQGRMEYGPRALGNRTIMAPTWDIDVKDRLNMQVKRRGWFQPFCPSLIEEDAKKIYEDYDGIPDNFMTMGYMTLSKLRGKVSTVIHIDGSSRPQMLEKENPKYRKVIESVKKSSGLGIILNTSFNLHGKPIVCDPDDAIQTMIETKTKYMVMNDFIVELK